MLRERRRMMARCTGRGGGSGGRSRSMIHQKASSQVVKDRTANNDTSATACTQDTR